MGWESPHYSRQRRPSSRRALAPGSVRWPCFNEMQSMQKRRGRDHIDCGRPWRLIDIALIMHDNTGPEPPKAGRVGSTAQMTLMPHLHVCQPPATASLHTHARTPFAAHQYGVRSSVRLLNEDWARAEQVKIIRDANECEIAFYDSLYALLPSPLRRCTSSTSDPQQVRCHPSWRAVAAATAAQHPLQVRWQLIDPRCGLVSVALQVKSLRTRRCLASTRSRWTASKISTSVWRRPWSRARSSPCTLQKTLPGLDKR